MSCGSLSCFFFKQKTAYEMRISDWSSDLFSSDLEVPREGAGVAGDVHHALRGGLDDRVDDPREQATPRRVDHDNVGRGRHAGQGGLNLAHDARHVVER